MFFPSFIALWVVGAFQRGFVDKSAIALALEGVKSHDTASCAVQLRNAELSRFVPKPNRDDLVTMLLIKCRGL